MDHGLGQAEDPAIGVAALDPHVGLVRGDHECRAKGRHGDLATGSEAPLRAAEQVHQAALAWGVSPNRSDSAACSHSLRERLEGLEIDRHRMKPRLAWGLHGGCPKTP